MPYFWSESAFQAENHHPASIPPQSLVPLYGQEWQPELEPQIVQNSDGSSSATLTVPHNVITSLLLATLSFRISLLSHFLLLPLCLSVSLSPPYLPPSLLLLSITSTSNRPPYFRLLVPSSAKVSLFRHLSFCLHDCS